MKKWFRILLRIACVIAVLLVVLVVALVTPVDHHPYFDTDYYRATLAHLESASAKPLTEHGELFAGYGEAKLSPVLGATAENAPAGQFVSLPLAGYGQRDGKPATGIHDDLHAKALAVRVGQQTGVFISADALIIPREIADMAAAELKRTSNLAREQIYFSATHTHGGLGGWGEGLVAEAFAGPFQSSVRVWFAQQLVAAAQSALTNLQPAAYAQTNFFAPELVRNRLVDERGRVDPEFEVALFRQNTGRDIVLGAFAAHATVVSARVMEFHGDYPGYWQRSVERATGGKAIFLAGGVGSHSPVAGDSEFAGAERLGNLLASNTVHQVKQLTPTNQIAFGLVGMDVNLPELNPRVTDGFRLRPWVAKELLPVQTNTTLQGFRLQNALWFSTPTDFSGELALDLKGHFQRQGFDATITSFNGDYIGYVIPAHYYHWSSYESRVMSFFGPTVPDYFCDLIRRMGQKLTPPQSEP